MSERRTTIFDGTSRQQPRPASAAGSTGGARSSC